MIVCVIVPFLFKVPLGINIFKPKMKQKLLKCAASLMHITNLFLWKNMKATEDFFLVVLYAYVVAAAKSWMSDHGDSTT